MVEHRVVLGHVVSSKGLEVDKAKVEIIQSFPYPMCVKEVRSFLVHVGFIGDSLMIFLRLCPCYVFY